MVEEGAEAATAATHAALRWLTAAVIVMLAVPLLLSPFPFWDGRILDHALTTGQNAGVREWFTTSGWHLQYLVVTLVQWVTEQTGLSGRVMVRLISIASVIGIAVEAVRFGERVAGLPRAWALVMGAAAAAYPTWNTLLSEVLFMYVLCAWLVLLGVRLVFGGSVPRQIVGLVITVASLQLNSNFVASIILAFAYAALAYRDGKLDKRVLGALALTVAAVVGAFLLLRLLYHPSGEYAAYNAFSPRVFDPRYLVVEMLRYFEYPIAVAAIVAAVAGVTAARRRARGVSQSGSNNGRWRHDLWPVAIGLMLIAGAAFPYIAVGKSTDLRLAYEWDFRHTIPMAFPLALFLASVARLLAGFAPTRVGPAVAAILVMWGAQQALLWGKLRRSAYEQGMVQAMQRRPAPAPGVVLVDAPQLPAPMLPYYEANWLFQRAWGREDWLARHAPQPHPSDFPAWLTAPSADTRERWPVYRSIYVMRGFVDRCHTSLRFTGAPYGLGQTARWVFGGSLPEAVAVAETGRRCAGEPMPPAPGGGEQAR